MNQKRILFLGGAYAQIPIIEAAKKRKWYVITCDYLPDNPGHKLADEYYNVSTTDYEGVLELAKKVKPDYVVAYASDPAAPVAAYVSEKLGLPGNPYESICILSEKDRFRELMIENRFNVPKVVVINEDDNPDRISNKIGFPIIVKPTDSSGSKGVSKVTSPDQLTNAIKYALQFSRKKRIIAEEFINNDRADIHGDGFVIDGELVFSYLGDHFYNSLSNPFNPIGTTWPSKQPESIIKSIEADVASLIKKSGFKNGAVNIEARVNADGKHYVMEIGPRSGGHFVPQAIYHATGFDMVNAILDQANGDEAIIPKISEIKSVAYYAIHSDKEGILSYLKIDNKLLTLIKELHQYKRPGDKVSAFHSANAAIGIAILSFKNSEHMNYYMSNISRYVDVKIKY